MVCLPAASRHKLLVKRRAENTTLHHDSFRYIVIVSVAHPALPFQKRDHICTTHSPMKAGRSPEAPVHRASASPRMHGVPCTNSVGRPVASSATPSAVTTPATTGLSARPSGPASGPVSAGVSVPADSASAPARAVGAVADLVTAAAAATSAPPSWCYWPSGRCTATR